MAHHAAATSPACPTGLQKDPAHKLCMIPGPVEFHEDVLLAMGTEATSHVDPGFIATFGEAIELLRQVMLTEKGQPFIVAGSGTLGWDMVASNLVEAGEHVLVLNTGYFGDRFAESLEVFGAHVTHLRAPVIGGRPTDDDMVSELKAGVARGSPYKLVTITHVDTSTAVFMDVETIAKAVHAASPSTLVVVDGVCSAGGEAIHMDAWGVDVVLTASQKALGTPPGLSVLVASTKAMEVFATRKAPIPNYYASWAKWLPIHKAYEERRPSYFATPPVQLVMALNVALKQILAAAPMTERFATHVSVSDLVKDTIDSWGLKQLPVSRDVAAHTLTAVYYPPGIGPTDLLPKIMARKVMVAGGLHPEINTKYFRIGHMGLSSTDTTRGHIATTLAAVRDALKEAGYQFPEHAKTEL